MSGPFWAGADIFCPTSYISSSTAIISQVTPTLQRSAYTCTALPLLTCSSLPHSSPLATLATVVGRQQSSSLSVVSSIEETRHWLASHRFSSYISLFTSYNGADLLRLSRRDLLELCGPADGIRLFNALRSRTLCTVYVCLEGETGAVHVQCACYDTAMIIIPLVYQALCLEQLTAHEFLCKLAEKVGLKPCQVSCVLQLTSSGLLVMLDDTVRAVTYCILVSSSEEERVDIMHVY